MRVLLQVIKEKGKKKIYISRRTGKRGKCVNSKITEYYESYPDKDYIEYNAAPDDFPKVEYIAYAVCGKECGHSEFIVDGQTQVCPKCHKQMFRTIVKKYILVDE